MNVLILTGPIAFEYERKQEEPFGRTRYFFSDQSGSMVPAPERVIIDLDDVSPHKAHEVLDAVKTEERPFIVEYKGALT